MAEEEKDQLEQVDQVEQGQDQEQEETTMPEEEIIAAETNQVDTDGLKKDLEEARAKSNEYLEGWQRARAEFTNYKRRVEREQASVYQNAAGSIIKRYIDVLDDLERALKNRPETGEGAQWAEGIELIYRKFLNILESEGVKQMDVLGKPFDANLEEAIAQEESDQYQSGEVTEVIKKGYMLGDRVLRPAMVKIAK